MTHHRAIKDWIVGLLPGTTPHGSRQAGDSNRVSAANTARSA